MLVMSSKIVAKLVNYLLYFHKLQREKRVFNNLTAVQQIIKVKTKYLSCKVTQSNNDSMK